MARTNNLTNFLTDVADAIRTKKGTTDAIPASNFDTEIENIEGGTDLSEYFSDTISSGTSSAPGFLKSISKLPAMTNSKSSCDYMFANFIGTSLDLSNFNTSSVTSMQSMFFNCVNLLELDLSNFNTSSVTSMASVFHNCEKLSSVNLSNFNTSSVTNMQSMFFNCVNLVDLDLSGFDCSKVSVVASMFNVCTNLTNITGSLTDLGEAYSTNIAANNYTYKLSLSSSNNLTEQSLINILNGLYDIATKGCQTQSVVLGSTNLAKLTSEAGQQALTNATAKGWTVS